jgi:class 3 adenylate cyclase
MPEGASLSAVNERLLVDKLKRLAAVAAADDALLDSLDVFVRTASDDAVVRINPVRFGQEHGFETAAVVELFLHARKLGLLTMEWQYVCPGCGEIVERLGSLTSATAHYFCQVCSADRDADLSDFIEIAFSVSPEIRRSRYHEPLSLEPEEHFFSYRFTQSGVVDDGSPLRDYLRGRAAACAYVESGATETFSLTAEPRYLWLTNGPALIVGDGRTDETRSFEFEYTGTRSKGFRAEIDAGPVLIEFTNTTDERYPLLITSLPDHFEVTMQPFLSGAEVLSNQTFLDLFAAETIVAGEGLAVRRLALLFTDLQGSTALYERIGDMKAFDLVRQHFGYLRECIRHNSGALVKTIGDAVMASFVDPLDALHAALEMQAEIARFNAEAGGDLIGLKVGLHAGACLAVTLNDRLDYFGQTVNIAARVQALSGAGEIVITEDVLSLPGAAQLVANLQIESDAVPLKGIAGEVRVHRVRGTPVDQWPAPETALTPK